VIYCENIAAALFKKILTFSNNLGLNSDYNGFINALIGKKTRNGHVLITQRSCELILKIDA